jgi:hypothetical protein
MDAICTEDHLYLYDTSSMVKPTNSMVKPTNSMVKPTNCAQKGG